MTTETERETPTWAQEAIDWIRAERAKHEDYTKRHMHAASSWAESGYIDISFGELRKAEFEAGMEHAFMLAHMRLLEGQQGER